MMNQMMARVLLSLLLGVLMFAQSPTARAEEGKAAPGQTETAGEAPHEEHDPMSFLDLPKRWDLTIYTIVVFLILFGILYFFAWPNISKGLEKREEMLSAVKDAADQARREAEEMSAKLKAEFATANDKVRAMLEEARRSLWRCGTTRLGHIHPRG